MQNTVRAYATKPQFHAMPRPLLPVITTTPTQTFAQWF